MLSRSGAGAPAAESGAERPRALVLGSPRGVDHDSLRESLDLRFWPADGEDELPGEAHSADVVVADVALGAARVVPVLRVLAGRGSPPPLVVVGSPSERAGFLRSLAGEALVAYDAESAELPGRIATALQLRALARQIEARDEEIVALRRRLATIEDSLAEDLRLAASVQRSLLPQPFRSPLLDLAAEFIPARDVGGDHFDLIELAGGRVAVAIGDVMGKGMPAALLAVNLKALVRAHIHTGEHEPAELIGRVNQVLYEVMPRGRFATLFFGIFDFDRGVLDYVNAGHYYPLALGRRGGVRELRTGGTVLGVLEDVSYEQGRLALRRGDLLVLYTDGVTDRLDRHGEYFGVERLKAAAGRARADNARVALYSVLGELQGWAAGQPLEDDLTLAVARVR